MVYKRNIPLGELSPAVQAVDIKNNFADFGTIFAVNHQGFNDTNQGKHTKVILQKQNDDPDVTQDLAVLYAKNDTQTIPQPQLFLKLKDFLPSEIDTNTVENTPIQLTHNVVNVAGPQYQSFFAGGFIVYIGSTTEANLVITLSPAPSSLLLAMASASSGVQPFIALNTEITGTDKFRIRYTTTSIPVSTLNWFAIGKI